MKFMKFSQPSSPSDSDKPSDEDSKKSPIPDNSQWDLRSLPTSKSVKKLKKRVIVPKRKANIRSNVSITDVKREVNPIVRGRRTVGEPVDEKSSKRSRSEADNDDYDLDTILKQVKPPR